MVELAAAIFLILVAILLWPLLWRFFVYICLPLVIIFLLAGQSASVQTETASAVATYTNAQGELCAYVRKSKVEICK
jgi:hypothetical protein